MAFVRGLPTFNGMVQKNKRVVDGVVDNGENYENWILGDSDFTASSNGISYLDTTGGLTKNHSLPTHNIKESTAYTAVANFSDVSIATARFLILNQGISSNVAEFTVSNGENRILVTTNASITTQEIIFRSLSSTVGDTYLFTFSFYEGDYVTGSPALPTSGQPVQGNSLISYDNPVIKREADANVGLTNDGFDRTDTTALVAKVQPITGDFNDKKLIVKTTPEFSWKLYNDYLSSFGDLQFTGKNKMNISLRNGNVDYVDSFIAEDSNWVKSGGQITGTADGVDHFFRIDNTSFKDNTQYTIVYTVISNTTDGTGIDTSTTGFTGVADGLTETVGENRILVTSGNPMVNTYLRVVLSSSNTTGTIVLDEEITVYEGDYVTGSPALPTSGQPVEGNSLIIDQDYPIMLKALSGDNLTPAWVDDDNTLDVPTRLVVPIADLGNINNDQIFVEKDENGNIIKLLIYDESLQEPCYTEVNIFSDLVEPLEDIDGSPLFDIDGSRLYALKEGVVRQ